MTVHCRNQEVTNPLTAGDVWMAEIGDHGWSQLCSSYGEAASVIDKQCKWQGHWAVWKNGDYVIGIWPGKP